MKKKFITPECKVIQLMDHMDIIQTSFVIIGGSTDSFNARTSNDWESFDDEDDYDE